MRKIPNKLRIEYRPCDMYCERFLAEVNRKGDVATNEQAT